MSTPVIVSYLSLPEAAKKVDEYGLFSKVPPALFGENNNSTGKASDLKVSSVDLCYEIIRPRCLISRLY